MRFFNLTGFRGLINLGFTLLIAFNVVRFGIVVLSTSSMRSQADELRLLNNIKISLKDMETEFDNAKLSLLHLIQGFSQEDRQYWQGKFKRNILNMNDLQRSIAANFDSLGTVESRIITDSLAMTIREIDRYGNNIFERANIDSLPVALRKTLYEEIYLNKIEDEAEPMLLRLLYFNIGKNYVDDRRLAILASQSRMTALSIQLNIVIFIISTSIILIAWYLLARRVNFSITKIFKKLRNILSGKLAKDDDELLKNEFRILDTVATQITEKLRQTVVFVDALGKGKYDISLEKFNNEDHYTQSLLQMRDALYELSVRDSKRNWVNETTAKFAELLRDTTKTANVLTRDFLRLIVREVDAQIGGVYLANTTGRGETASVELQLVAAYAYGRDKSIRKTIAPGEGLTGQCYLEGEKIVIKTGLHNFFYIPAGIGDIEPTSIIYEPIKLNTKILGVIELASVKPMEEHQIELIEKVSTLFAAAIESIRSFEINSQLLAQSQMLAEDLRSREEEMRQNMEELAATQEEMARSQTELFNRLKEVENAKKQGEEKMRLEQMRLQAIIQEKEHIIEELMAKSHN
ncbi:GAF domain-containing protein [Rhodoflexus sp.]